VALADHEQRQLDDDDASDDEVQGRAALDDRRAVDLADGIHPKRRRRVALRLQSDPQWQTVASGRKQLCGEREHLVVDGHGVGAGDRQLDGVERRRLEVARDLEDDTRRHDARPVTARGGQHRSGEQ